MIKTEILVYDGPGGPFEGTVSWDDAGGERAPGVLVSHAFGGQSQFDTDKAIELAELGYVGFAIDVYGRGRRASTPDEAYDLMEELNGNRPLLLRRMEAAVETLKNLPQVDESCIAAIGFCFGGKCVLDLARSGAELRAVVSFHGVYDPPATQTHQPIRTPILVLHGWDDPLGTPEHTVELATELTDRGADWQICAYGRTGHAFTNPRAQAPEDGFVYSPSSSKRAWVAMKNFLEEAFE